MKLLNPPDYILAKNLQAQNLSDIEFGALCDLRCGLDMEAAKWKLKKAHKLQTVGSSEAQQQSKKPRWKPSIQICRLQKMCKRRRAVLFRQAEEFRAPNRHL